MLPDYRNVLIYVIFEIFGESGRNYERTTASDRNVITKGGHGSIG